MNNVKLDNFEKDIEDNAEQYKKAAAKTRQRVKK